MREQIAASKLVNRDRERAEYKMKKRAMNMSRFELSPASETARTQGPCFQRFVKCSVTADSTPRGDQEEEIHMARSEYSTPSPFCQTTPNSGCS